MKKPARLFLSTKALNAWFITLASVALLTFPGCGSDRSSGSGDGSASDTSANSTDTATRGADSNNSSSGGDSDDPKQKISQLCDQVYGLFSPPDEGGGFFCCGHDAAHCKEEGGDTIEQGRDAAFIEMLECAIAGLKAGGDIDTVFGECKE